VLAERLFPASQAVAVYRQLLSLNVPDADLNLRIGRFLLARGEEAGVVALERAAAQDRTCARSVARLLARFFSERGQPETATRYLKEALAAPGP
jgi:Tfp pilus assembly protein PilF